jgi:hypothetical protein
VTHLDNMREKIARLRQLGSVEELERRWDEDDDFAERYNDSRLYLPDGYSLPSDLPGGLRDLYEICGDPTFGDIRFSEPSWFKNRKLIDASGNVVGDSEMLDIGRVSDEQFIFLNVDTGSVIIYDYMYFKHGMDNGAVLECEDIPQFVDTVALGPLYPDCNGPRRAWAEAWWLKDPWWIYLVEIGMVSDDE